MSFNDYNTCIINLFYQKPLKLFSKIFHFSYQKILRKHFMSHISLKEILNQHVNIDDENIFSYVHSLIDDSLESIHNETDLNGILCDILVSYQICKDIQSASLLSQHIWDDLVSNKLISDANESMKSILKSGMMVDAKYSDDNEYYKARITKLDIQLNKAYVLYVDYGNSEWVTISDIKTNEDYNSKNKSKIVKIIETKDDTIDSFINEQIYNRGDKLLKDSNMKKLIHVGPHNNDNNNDDDSKNEVTIDDELNEIEKLNLANIIEMEVMNTDQALGDDSSDDEDHGLNDDSYLKKHGYFYCKNSVCDGYLYVKSKLKRQTLIQIGLFICPKCTKITQVGPTYRYEYKLYNSDGGLKNSWKYCTYVNRYLKTRLVKLNENDNEFKEILKYITTVNYHVIKIERIENGELWMNYVNYCQNNTDIDVDIVWHGTSYTSPKVIYNNGYNVKKAQCGGCVWFAKQNLYSMKNYAYNVDDIQKQVFLNLVASSSNNKHHVIKKSQILNVYHNHVMYPAWLITFQYIEPKTFKT